MRGSDIVDMVADLMPRRLRRVASAIVLVVFLFGGGGLAQWYIDDKAAGINEMYQHMIEDTLENLAQPFASVVSDTVEPWQPSSSRSRT